MPHPADSSSRSPPSSASREQAPLDLVPLRTVRTTLATGDYSIRGLEDLVAIERKSLPDLIGCVGRERERFERELRRLRAYPARAVVVEASWADLERGVGPLDPQRRWRSEVQPAAVTGSILSWIAWGIPILLAGDRDGTARAVRGVLWHAARHRLRELRALAVEMCERRT
ncbi:MAG: hypothetical protein JXP34_19550 [Planctomycetes bacterium]|nr:hypothetical protein [Planctomycetota bacterium]